jgi:hypothetical protein
MVAVAVAITLVAGRRVAVGDEEGRGSVSGVGVVLMQFVKKGTNNSAKSKYSFLTGLTITHPF